MVRELPIYLAIDLPVNLSVVHLQLSCMRREMGGWQHGQNLQPNSSAAGLSLGTCKIRAGIVTYTVP